MFKSEPLEKSERIAYLGLLLSILQSKYCVNVRKLAVAIGINPSYLYDVLKHNKHSLSIAKINDLEYLLLDLYQPLLEYDIPDSEEDVRVMIEKYIEERSLK